MTQTGRKRQPRAKLGQFSFQNRSFGCGTRSKTSRMPVDVSRINLPFLSDGLTRQPISSMRENQSGMSFSFTGAMVRMFVSLSHCQEHANPYQP